MSRWLWIAVIAVALYFAWRWAGSTGGGQRYGPIKITYDTITKSGRLVAGQARDAAGVAFNSIGWNPGR